MNKFSVTIIGLGNIGMLYDYNNLSESIFLSHTKSFASHNGFLIKNLVDKDPRKLDLARKLYGSRINYLEDINQIEQMTDVVVIASIPNVNKILFDQLKNDKSIKLFLIEKPFWNNDFIIDDYKTISNNCYINYFRKSLPFIQDLKKEIDNKRFGKAIGVHAWYSKGLRNNGSHLIDLINYFFDKKFDSKSVKIINTVQDYNEKDLSVSFSIGYKYNNGKFPVIFQVADERKFSLIEIDLVFENARYRIFEFGGKVEVYNVEKDPVFEGYNNLISKEIIDTDINKYGFYTCDTIYKLLTTNARNYSSLQDEQNVYKVISQIKNMIE